MTDVEESKNNALTKENFEALAEFRYAIRQFLRFSENAAEAVGLTPNQHQALLAVKGFPGRDRITNGELAERLQIKHHSAVGLVNRLVAQDLVRREPGEGDRREVYLALTDTGEALLEQLAFVHRQELEQLAPHLTGILKKLKQKK
ncbi:MAG: MarR family transcriptional regulator [Acidobacteria bacterium]|nr:MarR family transcriptional regulator [Acidobacteriota bacterium]